MQRDGELSPSEPLLPLQCWLDRTEIQNGGTIQTSRC
jgi:hypothetical protein